MKVRVCLKSGLGKIAGSSGIDPDIGFQIRPARFLMGDAGGMNDAIRLIPAEGR